MYLDPIARLRRFNRAVVREAGALDTSYLGRGRPLGAARVLHLVRPEGTDVALIRATLGLDSGLMSRFLRALEREHLIETRTDPADRRRSIASLTAAGEAEVAAYLGIIHNQSTEVLAKAGSRTNEVLAAMDLIATVLNRDQLDIRPADPDAPEALACQRAYFDEVVARVAAARPEHFPLPDPHSDSYRPPQGRFLIAWSDDLPVGCVGLRALGGTTAEVKRLWVHGSARGQGLSRRLMSAIEAEARAMGHRALKLDTNSALTEAVALYRATGWTDIAPYTTPPADTWLGKPL
jgi:DNA-binding MarR family transcriptional regulator/ribosomal protein S18 acetylase RimI-like enzyme